MIKNVFLTIIIFLTLYQKGNSQHFFSSPFAHTFSIVARDSVTGEMGVAVQSHWFSVGSVVGWAEAGVGVIATQSFVNESFGVEGLKLLKDGKTPKEVVEILTEADSAKDVRQLAVMDMKGNTAAFTGKNCVEHAGHINGSNFSAQANLMLTDKVWPAMARAFQNSKGPLAERLIIALEAGQKEGGDIRGKQSAAILIVKGTSSGKIWEDKTIDLRVEDNEEPITELKRLIKIHRAYEHMSKGDLAIEKNNMSLALKEYSSAEEMFPKNLEMKFWHAVALCNQGQTDQALPLFKVIFKKDNNWALLIPRLVKAGLLTIPNEELDKIVAIK